MGVPADYKPAYAPLWPYPANYNSLNSSKDPNYDYYGTNTIWVPVTDSSTPYRTSLDGNLYGSPLSPWINQAVPSTALWTVDSSLFKTFRLRERAKLRLQFDFFNVFNVPGNSYSPGEDGIVGTWTNANNPRVMQMSARLTW